MNNELTPLEALKTLFGMADGMCEFIDSEADQCFNIIETALKEKENIEKTFIDLFSENGKVITSIEIKKKLKALEIIKRKKVDCWTFIIHCWMDYREFERGVTCSKEKLTQEEFDLLKEVLK